MIHSIRIAIVILFAIGVLSTASNELLAQNRPGNNRGEIIKQLKASDKNKDGKITKEELPERMRRMFSRMDTDGSGAIDAKEIEALEKRFADRQRPGDSKNGDARSSGSGVAPGKPAPDFTLKSLDGKSEVKLSSFKEKKPVALIFGSYT